MFYTITVTSVTVGETRTLSYGLCLTDESLAEPDIIEDISTDLLFVRDLAELFNSQSLQPEHFHDAVEDSLA